MPRLPRLLPTGGSKFFSKIRTSAIVSGREKRSARAANGARGARGLPGRNRAQPPQKARSAEESSIWILLRRALILLRRPLILLRPAWKLLLRILLLLRSPAGGRQAEREFADGFARRK